ncbi:protein-L-isoaspartate O-methyltransferase [Acuticoccus sp. MNP-M23]|uniref:protein-L-isoaspartate O-methyltransferase family protein n=1 Tax=Acuticoccus sp. MNP-M23 TaxID=3072793 RepID=UPI002814AC42|nr:protein-L-isoaspartate O-methyltransferase [Acuticoccus sp. MNP-M23]WMS41779.1 protein-L-isoaspartate O-methyltransferase [Acuticoccus sp. MNP-M23]
MGDESAVLRTRMVNNQLRTFDVTDHRVQDAVLDVKREDYVPADQRMIAYSDDAITIARDEIGRPTRTMTRPAVLGRLLQQAQITEDDVVLLVGAGRGYTAALIGCLAGSVIALESDSDLAEAASTTLEYEEVTNVAVVVGPLTEGYATEAPFDVIFCDGAIMTEPTTLLGQLKDGGRLIAIEGEGLSGRAKLYTKAASGVSMRYAFNAAAGPLPGFAPAPEFVF